MNSNHPEEALLLALESIGNYGTLIPYPGEGSVAVQNVLDSAVQEIAYMHHDNVVRGAVWNGDASRVLSWSDDKTARVWDASSGKPLLTLRHETSVTGAVWNGDASRVLSWSNDGSVWVWDANSGKALLTLRHGSFVIGAAWNGNASRILSWSNDGSVWVWDANSGKALLTVGAS